MRKEIARTSTSDRKFGATEIIYMYSVIAVLYHMLGSTYYDIAFLYSSHIYTLIR